MAPMIWVFLMHRPTLFSVLLVTMATPCLAADADPIAAALDRCLADPANSATAGQTSCESQATRRYDERMNAAYRALLSMLPPVPAQRLREAQRTWLIFRSADAKAQAALYATRRGTMYVPLQAHAETVTVRDRTLQLEAYLRALRIEQ